MKPSVPPRWRAVVVTLGVVGVIATGLGVTAAGRVHSADAPLGENGRAIPPGQAGLASLAPTRGMARKPNGAPSPEMAGMPGMAATSKAPLPGSARSRSTDRGGGGGLADVVLSPEQQVLANVATTVLSRRSLGHDLATVGQVTFDETRQAQVTARVDGRIERLYVSTTGAQIEAGHVMATVYSPDVVATMQEDLSALAAYKTVRASGYSDLAAGSRTILDSSRRRLVLWGLSREQVARLEQGGKPSLALPLLAPTSGTVIKKMVVPGQYVKTGDVLFEVADLSRVWVLADVFAGRLGDVRVGETVSVTTPTYPGKRFAGRVTFISPVMSSETRTAKVRIELANPHGWLKPDMYVSATLRMPNAAATLSLPATAVLDTGDRRVVFVALANGVFRPREVTLGAKTSDFYPVLAGLHEGDRVATSGAFLLDANSQIQSGQGTGMAGMDMSGKGGKP